MRAGSWSRLPAATSAMSASINKGSGWLARCAVRIGGPCLRGSRDLSRPAQVLAVERSMVALERPFDNGRHPRVVREIRHGGMRSFLLQVHDPVAFLEPCQSRRREDAVDALGRWPEDDHGPIVADGCHDCLWVRIGCRIGANRRYPRPRLSRGAAASRVEWPLCPGRRPQQHAGGRDCSVLFRARCGRTCRRRRPWPRRRSIRSNRSYPCPSGHDSSASASCGGGHDE